MDTTSREKTSGWSSAEKVIASHLWLAAKALIAATALHRIGNPYAAYQAEQAVEQLTWPSRNENIHVTRSQHHQLETMGRALPAANAAYERLARLTWLDAYATTYRHPRPMGGLADDPDSGKLDDAVAPAGRLLDRVAKHFQVDLAAGSRRPAAHARAPRDADLDRADATQ